MQMSDGGGAKSKVAPVSATDELVSAGYSTIPDVTGSESQLITEGGVLLFVSELHLSSKLLEMILHLFSRTSPEVFRFDVAHCRAVCLR